MPRVLVLPYFQKQFKKFRKRLPRAAQDICHALEFFSRPRGVYLGKSAFKIRVRARDIGKGTRGGFRVIVLFLEIEHLVIPMTLYLKSEKENISDEELNKHVTHIRDEIQSWRKKDNRINNEHKRR
jgi:hypothetical protein